MLWQAAYALDPWGEDRADLRAGIVAALTANIHRGSEVQPFKPSDFMPQFGAPENPDENQFIEQFMAQLNQDH